MSPAESCALDSESYERRAAEDTLCHLHVYCDTRFLFSLTTMATAAAPAQRLPPEVLDFIMDGNRTRSKKKTLASCSLVCKAWLQSSRYHLFSEFDVYVGPHVGASFLQLLDNPLCTFRYCIRSVSIYPGAPDLQGTAHLGDSTITTLAKMKNVTTLRIHNHRGLISKPKLSLLASTFSEITTLRITNSFPCFNDAIEFVALFPALTALDFYPYCVEPTPTTLPGTSLPPKLRSLHLHSPFKYRSWFSEHYAHLPSLTLSHIRSDYIPTVQQIMKASGSNLHHLSIIFPEWPVHCYEFIERIKFHCNPQLSSFEIDLMKTYPNPGEVLLWLLSTMQTPNLRVLTLKAGGFWHNIPWTEIEEKITDRNTFKYFRQLHIVTTDENLPPLWKRFPKADAVGIAITQELGKYA
ncbi:hypothetical protein B0H11DRAFT_641270 [Mycena galericulata]|nr:hypothetical protein B0H11DRAFT_641270 [Mycena galericulata]